MTATLPRGSVEVALERLYPAAPRYLHDPVGWAQKKLGRYIWSKQIEVMEAVRDNRLVAVASCHGPGKTFSASSLGAWWLDPETHPLGSAFLVTTAPSYPQVEQILWRELRRRYREGKLRGRITLDCKWHMGEAESKRGSEDEEIIGIGRKPADYDEATFQGIHARYFMAILDEACGVPDTLKNAVLSLATNENARILAIGNPDDPGGWFANVCKPGSGWKVIWISVWDTPNFTQEIVERYRAIGAVPDWYQPVPDEPVPDEVAEGLVSPLWVDDRITDWGIGSPIWEAKVNGRFPDISDEYLIAPALIDKCRYMISLDGQEHGRYGLDVARFGSDKSVLYRNRGGQIRLVEAWGKKDTMETAGKVAAHVRSHPMVRVPINVDIIGLGSGVFDRLREQRFPVAPYQGSQAAVNPAKFLNRRSEAWWTFRELMEAGLIDLDEKDDQLAADLGSVKWATNSAGRIFIETKEDLVERLGRSPNHADAAVMSTVAPGSLIKYDDDKRNNESIAGDILTRVM